MQAQTFENVITNTEVEKGNRSRTFIKIQDQFALLAKVRTLCAIFPKSTYIIN